MHVMIDLTDQVAVEHEFAHAPTTLADERQAKRVLQNVHKHIAEFIHIEMRPNSVSFVNRNRRNLRIIFYDLDKLLHHKDLFVVIFYAHKRPNLSEEFNQEFFETDWKIAMGLMDSGNILCYASQELADGNWFNVVLFTKEADKHAVTGRSLHHHAAYELAPKRFDWIRLHNAYLPAGLMGHRELIMKSTKYYNFDDNWFAARSHEGKATK